MKESKPTEEDDGVIADTSSKTEPQRVQLILISGLLSAILLFVLTSCVLQSPQPALMPVAITYAPTLAPPTSAPTPRASPTPTSQATAPIERVLLMKLPRVWFRNDAQMQPQVSPDGRWMYRVVNPAQNEYEVRVTRIVSTTGADSVLDESIKPFHFTAQSIQKLIPWSPDSGAFAVVSADRVNAQDTSGRVFIFEPTSVTGVLSPIGVLTVAKMMPATAWTPSGGALGIGDGDDILVFTRTNTSSIRVQASLSTPSLKWQQSDRLFALAFGGLRQSATLAALFDPLHPADGLTAFTIEDRRAVVLGGQTDTLPFLLVCEEVRDTQAISHRLALFNVETGESRPLGELRQPATCTFMKSATAPLSHYTLIQSELGNNTDDANLWLFDWQRMHLQSLGRVERLLSYNTSDAAQGFAVVVEQPDGFWLERIRPTQ